MKKLETDFMSLTKMFARRAIRLESSRRVVAA